MSDRGQLSLGSASKSRASLTKDPPTRMEDVYSYALKNIILFTYKPLWTKFKSIKPDILFLHISGL